MALLRGKVLTAALIAFSLSICICGGFFLYQRNTNSFAKSIPVVEHLAYYATPQKNTSLQQAIVKLRQGQFTTLNNRVLNKGIARDYYWVYFTVSNKGGNGKRLMLDIDNSRLNEIELFQLQGDSVHSLGKLGDFAPFSQRRFKDKSFLYYLYVEAFSNAEYFLYINQVGSTLTLPMKVVAEAALRSKADRDLFLDGMVYGILFFVALMSLLFFLTSRHLLYLYYGAYIITGIAWLFSYFGMGYAYIWGNYPALNTAMAPITASLNIFLNLQICQILIKLYKNKRQLNIGFEFCKILLLVTAVFPILINLNDYGYTINHVYLVFFLSIILAAMVLVSYTVFTRVLKESMAAKLYFFASLIKAVGIINLALLELGLVPAVANMEEILQLGIVVEISLLTYALASRYANYKLHTFSKVIEAHEKERSIISKEIHDSISNSLTGIHYGIDDVIRDEKNISPEKRQTLQLLSAELKRLHTEARNISHNVMPDYINNYGIGEIIGRYIEELKSRRPDAKNIIINFSPGNERFEFSKEIKLNVFRIVQEIITNMLKHSQATQMDITLAFAGNKLMIIAEDNGIGIKQSENNAKGMGMENIKSRVGLLQGTIRTGPGLKLVSGTREASTSDSHGTRIEIKIPYKATTSKNNTDEPF